MSVSSSVDTEADSSTSTPWLSSGLVPPRSSLSVVVVVDSSVSRSMKPRLPDVRFSVAGGVVFESSVAVGGILVPGMVFRDTGGLLGCLGLGVNFGIELLAEVLFGRVIFLGDGLFSGWLG